jgi:hypothetical protein
MKVLQSITINFQSRTIEVRHKKTKTVTMDGEDEEITIFKARTYSEVQYADFVSSCGADANGVAIAALLAWAVPP